MYSSLSTKQIILLFSLGVFFYSAFFPSIGFTSTLPLSVDGKKLPTLADVVEKVEHGIVNISTATQPSTRRENFSLDELREFLQGDDFFQQFFNHRNQGDRRRQRPRRSSSLGSGVIIDAEKGHILTNYHLLVDNSDVQVTLLDGRTTVADIVGTDPDMDLALLKVDLPDLVAIEFGNSDELRVGDFVLALGNNYGLSATVTSGIVSALGRSGLGLERYEEYIQTDAAINPGSSGGALVNLRGEVVGINTAILSTTGGNIGIAFAIPGNSATSVYNQIVEFGRVRRGVLGIHFQELTQEIAEAMNIEKIEGVLIRQVIPNSAAEQAGMQEGDILLAVNGRKIIDGSQLRTIIALIRVGENVDVQYRRDDEILSGAGIIGDRVKQTLSGIDITDRLDGAVFENIPGSELGVLVAAVEQGSPAWRSGIREGDIVLEVNQDQVATVDEINEAVPDSSDLILLRVIRENETYYIALH